MTCAAGFRRRTPSKSDCKFWEAHAARVLFAAASRQTQVAAVSSLRNDGLPASLFVGSAIYGGRESPLEKLYESADGDWHRREGPPHQFRFSEVWHLR